MSYLDDAWNTIATVRDRYPRLPDDAPTLEVVDALDAAGLLVDTNRTTAVPELWRMEVSGTDDSQSREVVVEVGTKNSVGAVHWEPIETFLFRLAAAKETT